MKAYRFFSEPGHIVSDGNTGLAMFKFDEQGEYVTLDGILAQRMAPHFRHEEIELAEVKEQADEIQKRAENVGNDAQIPSLTCPHCGFEAKTESGLSAHMRSKHKEV